MIFFLDADDHKKVVSSYLSHLSREEIISLGKALGLKKKTMETMSEMPGITIAYYESCV